MILLASNDANVELVRKKIKRKTRLKNDFDAWILMIPMVIVLYLAIWRPTVIGGVWSFMKMRGYTPLGFNGFENYRIVITNSEFLILLKNTALYVLWSLVIGFIPPVAIAIMLNEMVFCRSGLRIIIYLPAVIPGIASMLIWRYIYDPGQTGLLNQALASMGIAPYGWLQAPEFTIVGLVIYMTWAGFAGTMLLYYACVQGTSVELYEAALIDGAGPFKRVWHVTLPALAGILVLNVVRQIIGVFQTMDVPLAMTGGGPNNASNTLSLRLYELGIKNASKTAGQAMALGVIIFLILIVFTCFYFWINKKVEDNY